MKVPALSFRRWNCDTDELRNWVFNVFQSHTCLGRLQNHEKSIRLAYKIKAFCNMPQITYFKLQALQDIVFGPL